MRLEENVKSGWNLNTSVLMGYKNVKQTIRLTGKYFGRFEVGINLTRTCVRWYDKVDYKVCMFLISPINMVGAGIATGYELDHQGVGVRVPVGSRMFCSPRRPDQLWGPPSLLSNGDRRALSPGVKRQGPEAEHSPPASAEVKKIWIYTSTPPYAFVA
jgi:hypothetical protein